MIELYFAINTIIIHILYLLLIKLEISYICM